MSKLFEKQQQKRQIPHVIPKSATKYKKRLFWYGQASPLGWHPVKRLKGNAFVKWVRTRARHPLAWTKYWLYKQIKISFVPQRPTPIPFWVHHQHHISDNLIRTFSQSFPIVWTFSPRELNFFVAIVLRWILGCRCNKLVRPSKAPVA